MQYLSDRWWWSSYTYNGNKNQTAHEYTYADICKNFLIKIPTDVKSDADDYVKNRLSLVELAFKQRWEEIQDANSSLESRIIKAEAEATSRPSRGLWVPGSIGEGMRQRNTQVNMRFNALVDELNQRLRLALYNLTFHNGMIQVVNDAVVNAQVAQPFWSFVATDLWSNVDLQMKEALDRRDNGDRTAAFHAVCALESCIKIISAKKGWTTGRENGAAYFVDNLVSKKNGRFVDPWEAEILKGIFTEVRNHFAHGPGQEEMPKLSVQQTEWAIDTAMSWIKNLVRRM